MARVRDARDEHAARRLRARRAARRGGDGDARALPLSAPRVVVYHAEGCHLCERALAVVRAVVPEVETVDIGGDEALEARYRERIPVVEIDGEAAFTYFVDEAALRARLAQSRSKS